MVGVVDYFRSVLVKVFFGKPDLGCSRNLASYFPFYPPKLYATEYSLPSILLSNFHLKKRLGDTSSFWKRDLPTAWSSHTHYYMRAMNLLGLGSIYSPLKKYLHTLFSYLFPCKGLSAFPYPMTLLYTIQINLSSAILPLHILSARSLCHSRTSYLVLPL